MNEGLPGDGVKLPSFKEGGIIPKDKIIRHDPHAMPNSYLDNYKIAIEMVAVVFQCLKCYTKWICERDDGKRCPECKSKKKLELWSSLTGVILE